jgi:hypothetical protein
LSGSNPRNWRSPPRTPPYSPSRHSWASTAPLEGEGPWKTQTKDGCLPTRSGCFAFWTL